MKPKPSWKTTCFGLLAGLGSLLAASSPNPKAQAIGQIAVGLGVLGTGVSAADHSNLPK